MIEVVPEGLPVVSAFFVAINGKDEERLINLLDENFHWQGGDTGGGKQNLITYFMRGASGGPEGRIVVQSIQGATEESPLFRVNQGIHFVRPQFAYKISYQYTHPNLQSSTTNVMNLFIKNGKVVWLTYTNESP